MGAQVVGVKLPKAQRRAALKAAELARDMATLEATRKAAELGELAAAGVSRRGRLVWQLTQDGRPDRAIAQHLGMTLKAVQESRRRASDKLFAYREAHLPEIADPADLAESGLRPFGWLMVCAEAAVECEQIRLSTIPPVMHGIVDRAA